MKASTVEKEGGAGEGWQESSTERQQEARPSQMLAPGLQGTTASQ